ncbi:hypothetical protein [Chryseobacterium indoltheticum]|uniref:hypothetical protein n=1 Tax=Chryseobacterium indoltheticum TaxID=254 RepID=UPI003F49282B
MNKILSKETRYDIRGYDASKDAVYTSSYLVLKNNMWEPVGIIYIPLYHNESAYMEVLHKYVIYILLIDFIIIVFSIWLSWLLRII